MSRKHFGEECDGNRKQSQWLEDLTVDVGGWWGLGLGTVMTLYGAFMGFVAFLVGGPILISIAVLLAIFGWFKNK